MPKKKKAKRETKRVSAKTKKAKKRVIKVTENPLTQIKFGESYVSLLLGIVVVIVVAIVGIVVMNVVRHRAMVAHSNSLPAVATQKITQSKTVAKTKMHVVAEGEGLWQIAEKEYHDGYKWTDIAKANNLQNPDVIFKGTKLTIPEAVSAQKIEQKNDTATSSALLVANKKPEHKNISTTSITTKSFVKVDIKGNKYVVKKGDVLWDIAERAYGDGFKWTTIAKANNLENPGLIFSGNELIIPRG